MKLQIIVMLLMAIAVTGCSKGKGPSRIVNPPVVTPPPGGGTQPPGPVPPGTGTNGKLQVQVEEGGTVTTNPAIGSCAGQPGDKYCEFTAPRGTVVTLTAQPWAGWAFEEWDNCPGPSGTQCVITIGALDNVKAEFDRT